MEQKKKHGGELVDLVDGSIIAGGEVGGNLSTALVRRQYVLERLNNRREQQQAKTAAAQLARKKMVVDGDLCSASDNNQWILSEECHTFDKSFSQKVEQIHERLRQLKESKSNGVKNTECAPVHDEGDGSHLVKKDLASTLAEINLEIQELQKFLTSSTMFLPNYNIKSCQDAITELTTELDNVRSKLLPKKRFGFSGGRQAKTTSTSQRGQETLTPPTTANNKTLIKEAVALHQENNTLSKRSHEYICLNGDEVNGKDITISQLEKCFVELQGHPGSVQISNALECIFLIGPTSRSLFAEHCKDCILNVACQQLRFHSSSECKLYLHVTCRAIIEDCREIEVSTYQKKTPSSSSSSYPGIEQDFLKAGLNPQLNNYTDVADFNWLSSSTPSPNWHLSKDHQSQNAIDWQFEKQKFLKMISEKC